MSSIFYRIVRPYAIFSVLVVYAVCATYYGIVVQNNVMLVESIEEASSIDE